jgi:uncharacterized protein (DUF427 family)
MSDHIKIRRAGGTWVVRAAGAVIGESANALELTEGDYPPVIYFPREDIAMAFMEPTATRTVCPHKGEAIHFAIIAKSGTIPDAAWSYETPKPGMERIARYLAFYPEKATTEQL